MSQLAIILTFVLIGTRELVGAHAPAAPSIPLWQYLIGFGVVCIAGAAAVTSLAKVMDRRGSIRAAMNARRAAGLMRWSAVALHAWNVLALGWVEAVRYRVGNLVAVDEVLAAAPVIATWLVSWWAIAPVERRLHEAVLFRTLETGGPVYAPLSRPAYVWMTFRHQALFLIVPILLVLSWGECVDLFGPRFGWGSRDGDMVDIRALAAEIVGVLAVFAVMPFLLRLIWDTVPLGEGELRTRLTSLARDAGAKFRHLLVWRTRGNVINGLVAGLTGSTRHVLLSDALLDSLPERQVEAVAAHEFGHIRRHHILWLGLVMISMMFALGLLAEFAARAIERAGMPADPASWWITAAMVAAGVWLFGWVSRQFEWQADAFAAQSLSHAWQAGKLIPGISIGEEAVGAMGGALEGVAALNGLSRHKFAWRHGSIATRQERLAGIVGLDSSALPIDRQVAWIKAGSVAVLLGAIAGAWWLGS